MLAATDTYLNQHSYYEASVERPPLGAKLQENLQTDVLVVGAGFAGLSAAIELAQRGFQVVVLEAARVGAGASGRNGGQSLIGLACGQAEVQAQLGREAARQVWDIALEGARLIDERIAAFGIDCDRVHGYLYVADSARKAKTLLQEMQGLQRDYGLACELAEGAQTQRYINSPRYQAAAYERLSGHLHPLKYCLGLAQAARSLGVKIYESSAVTALQRGKHLLAHTAEGSVSAGFGVLAGNVMLSEFGPQLAPELGARIMPVGTYIAGTAPLPEATARDLIPSNASVCDNNFVLDYFRFSQDRRLLFGGRVSYTTHTPRKLAQVMARRMETVFPQLRGVRQEFLWGGFVDISFSRAPDFGRLAPNLYYLQGFSGHGVALTGVAGRMVAQAIAGQAQRFDLFAQLKNRDFPGGAWLRTPSLLLGTLYYRLRDYW